MIVALDLETTGLSPEKDKIIEFAAFKIKDDGTIVDQLHHVINPGIKIPSLITNLTGITDEEVEGKPSFEEVKESIQAFVKDAPILGHSVQFDINFLQANGVELTGKVLDTFRLAQTLLPNEPSYSLEVLSEKFGLSHDNAHRADDDTKVCIELHKILMQVVRDIDPTHHDNIRSLLEKSDWGWKQLLLDHLDPNATGKTTENPTKKKAEAASHEALRGHILAHLNQHESTLIEAPFYQTEDLLHAAILHSESSGEKIMLATPHQTEIQTDERIANLYHPGRYLCTTQFKKVMQQSHFSNDETRLYFKLTLWEDRTETGLKHEIVVGNDEQSAWNKVSAYHHLFGEDCNDPHCFYTQAKQASLYRPVLIISPQMLLENIIERGQLFSPHPQLILDEIERFETTATNTFTRYFSLSTFSQYTQTLERDDLDNRFAILFGILGLICEKYAAEDAFAQQTLIDENLATTAEWHKLQGALDGLNEDLNALPLSTTSKILRQRFEAFRKALSLSPRFLTWIMTNLQNEPIVRACPYQIGQLMHQEIWSKLNTLIGISGFGMIEANFKFLKNRLALPEEIMEVHLPADESAPLSSPDLVFHPELPNTRSPKNLQVTTDLIQDILRGWLEQASPEESVFILANSARSCGQLHEKLVDFLNQKEANLLSQGMSGGYGKIVQLFKKSPTPTVLIGTHKLYDQILNTPKAESMTHLLIHRVPFLPPSHPVHERESQQLNNGFIEYSLPNAILRLKHFVYDFRQKTSGRTIHFLDPRFDNYDGKLRNALQKNEAL
jgi:DNA polymerase III epsilon subunit family exonuclease